MVNNLIENYFNLLKKEEFSFKDSNIRSNFKRIIEKEKSKYSFLRKKYFSQNKIFISKTEIKHSNNKVNILIYTYNKEIKIYLQKLKKGILNLVRSKSIQNIYLSRIKQKRKTYLLNKIISYKLEENIKNNIKFNNKLISKKIAFFFKREDLQLKIIILLYKYGIGSLLLNNNKLKFIINKSLTSLKKLDIISKKFSFELEKHKYSVKKHFSDKNFTIYKEYFIETSRKTLLYNYILYNKLKLNENKFKKIFISSAIESKKNLTISDLIYKIYGKKVEFNIINLKYLHLNSDIVSDSISIYLRNRKKKLLNILKKYLKKFKLPLTNNYLYKYKNKEKNKNLDCMLTSIQPNINISKKNFDSINNSSNNTIKGTQEMIKIHNNNNKTLLDKNLKLKKNINIILKNIKFKTIKGIKFEATGRLSKRLTASKSIYKYKYKGSLKNIDSSYKSLSTIMLRGNIESNIQYTKINSKTQNGAFGLKS